MFIITYRSWGWASVVVVLPWMARCRLLDLILLELVFIFELVLPLLNSISILVAASVAAVVAVTVPAGCGMRGTR
jgi:hypothetical protein